MTWKNPIRLIAATLALAAGSAVPASARFSAVEGEASVRVARHFWHAVAPDAFDRPGYGCSPHAVTLRWTADLGSAMASAIVGGCVYRPPTINLERPTVRRFDDVRACGVVTHEYGHLLGYRHSSNPGNVMSGDPGLGRRAPRRATWKRAWRRCERRL